MFSTTYRCFVFVIDLLLPITSYLPPATSYLALLIGGIRGIFYVWEMVDFGNQRGGEVLLSGLSDGRGGEELESELKINFMLFCFSVMGFLVSSV